MLPHFRVACRSVELVGDVKLYEVASINNPKSIVSIVYSHNIDFIYSKFN